MEKITGWLQRAWVVLVVAGIIIVFDQLTKNWVRATIPEYTAMLPVPALGEYLVFEHVRNYGAAFGILQQQSLLFVAIAFVVAVAILVYVKYLPIDQRFVRILLGLQLGGAVGNLIDRLQQGFVTDFVKMGIPGVYYWPNYNVADSSIVIGVIGLGIFILMEDMRKQREEQAQKQANEQL
ncbi:MAG: signal peptidase II [Caldilineaceae bacterium]|nr:signal peptidase II [Caldilineaceae bacterium]MCB0120646.1 signal peptidase II [Caldilineaceae bacterium]HRW04749.1 signal peptidase II [Caldilineaceae bacterium]